jgi:hypothetical protein
MIFFTSRIHKEEDIAYDKEVQAFVDMVTTVRSQYKHNVEKTNMGLIISPQIKSTYPAKTSIKVIVRYDRCLTKDNMVTFTCDVSTSVVHIIFTVIAELPGTICLRLKHTSKSFFSKVSILGVEHFGEIAGIFP